MSEKKETKSIIRTEIDLLFTHTWLLDYDVWRIDFLTVIKIPDPVRFFRSLFGEVRTCSFLHFIHDNQLHEFEQIYTRAQG